MLSKDGFLRFVFLQFGVTLFFLDGLSFPSKESLCQPANLSIQKATSRREREVEVVQNRRQVMGGGMRMVCLFGMAQRTR